MMKCENCINLYVDGAFGEKCRKDNLKSENLSYDGGIFRIRCNEWGRKND